MLCRFGSPAYMPTWWRPEKESGLSKFPLLWMIDEAVKSGLAVDRRTVNQLAWGVQQKGSPFSYVSPDIMRDPPAHRCHGCGRC
jgi:hypothetical protein